MQTKNKIRTYSYPDGSIQRVQVVELEHFKELDFFFPKPSIRAYEAFCDIYHRFLIPQIPFHFGRMVMFHLGLQTTKDKEIKKDIDDLYAGTCERRYGKTQDALCKLTVIFKENLRITKDGVRFNNRKVKQLYEALLAQDMLRVESGLKRRTHMIPIGLKTGYLAESEKEAALKVNSSFFIMDRFDLASVYDRVGTPIGLMVKDGKILNPPLYKREALLVHKDGRIEVAIPSLFALGIRIGAKTYRHADNCEIYTRPAHKKTPPPQEDVTDLVIIGKEVLAVHEISPYGEGQDKALHQTEIPASGFVLRVQRDAHTGFLAGESVSYSGLKDILFGIQVGNSILQNGEITKCFISSFYDINKPGRTPFPPSLYPLDFEGQRASRIALGANESGRPVLIWAEGAGKIRYEKGIDSRGATLAEMGKYCLDAGMVNALNLDGGGSAQILLYNQRHLKISDRRAEDNAELPRAVPCGLIVRG